MILGVGYTRPGAPTLVHRLRRGGSEDEARYGLDRSGRGVCVEVAAIQRQVRRSLIGRRSGSERVGEPRRRACQHGARKRVAETRPTRSASARRPPGQLRRREGGAH